MPALQVVHELRRLGSSPAAVAKRDLLMATVNGEFGSLIQYAIDEYL